MNLPETETEATTPADNAKPKLSLDVQVKKTGTCERRISVTIAREDVDRYLQNAFSELVPNAAVPGFRAGRAPRKLVEQRFREQVSDQVKGALLMDSMSQISEDYDFSAISEPDFTFDAIDLPEKGPMKFEFNLEVRPEFDLPEWKGLKLERLVREYTPKDIDQELSKMLSREGVLEPFDGPVELGDYIVANIRVTSNDNVISEEEEVTLQVLAKLNFPDGRLDDFAKTMTGAKAGDKRTAKVTVSHDAPVEELQGKHVEVEFEVLEVKRATTPDIDSELLTRVGGFSTEGELRDAIQSMMQRRLEYDQQQRIRNQISSLLTQSATWELPPDLVRRQSRRELERAILEMRRSGFAEDEIRSYENELKQNSLSSTRKALQEHFILERIAEESKIEADPADYEEEVKLIAQQSRESIRRVRARIEKKGWMDALRNQIIERKVIALITEHAEFKDVKYEPEKNTTVPIDLPLCGRQDAAIPEAKYGGGESQTLQQPVDRT